VSFLPAASKEAVKAMGRVLRSWQLANRSDKTLADLVRQRLPEVLAQAAQRGPCPPGHR
jgi:hypothetical protein